MLLRLPASMHVPSVELPRLSLPFPPLSLSSTSVLLALLASLVLLATARAVLLFLRPTGLLSGKPPSVSVVSVSDIKSAPPAVSSSPTTQQQRRSSWAWGLITWDSLPSLPVSLSAKPVTTEMRGRGVGLRSGPPTTLIQQQQQMQQVQSWQGRRGPAFERPVPAIYQTDVPASMAKMIMSRHTFRRPASPRPPPRSSQTPQIQIQRRTPSMV